MSETNKLVYNEMDTTDELAMKRYLQDKKENNCELLQSLVRVLELNCSALHFLSGGGHSHSEEVANDMITSIEIVSKIITYWQP